MDEDGAPSHPPSDCGEGDASASSAVRIASRRPHGGALSAPEASGEMFKIPTKKSLLKKAPSQRTSSNAEATRSFQSRMSLATTFIRDEHSMVSTEVEAWIEHEMRMGGNATSSARARRSIRSRTRSADNSMSSHSTVGSSGGSGSIGSSGEGARRSSSRRRASARPGDLGNDGDQGPFPSQRSRLTDRTSMDEDIEINQLLGHVT